MTEFTRELKHYCRNPRCRMKLPQPVENTREQFCCRGCYLGFYRFRCLICEEPIERKTEYRQICTKHKCSMALQAVQRHLGTAPLLGRFATSKRPEKPALKVVGRQDRRAISWHIVAGPPNGISANAFYCATVGADDL